MELRPPEFTDLGLANLEIMRLRAGICAMLSGNYPNPRDHRPGRCRHGVHYWEECGQCSDAWLEHILKGGSDGGE